VACADIVVAHLSGSAGFQLALSGIPAGEVEEQKKARVPSL